MDQLTQNIAQLQIGTDVTGFIHNEFLLKHEAARKHPECPGRTKSIVETITKYLKSHTLPVEQITEFGQCTKEDILLVHSEDYFNVIDQAFDVLDGEEPVKYVNLGDSYLNPFSPNCARTCVQGALIGLDKIMEGKWRNAFCAIRPPGHHAGHKVRPNGFCLYNNVAIAARYARKKYGVDKILILDWDVHHCDGTEHIFYDDPNTLVISIHRYDNGTFYPCSGTPENIGGKHAQYMNVNIGWNCANDETPGPDEYIYCYDRLIEPIVNAFKPELIIISAGYDSAKGDPLGCIDNTPEGYQYYTAKLMQLNSKVLAVLEGGYNLQVTANCALATLQALVGEYQLKVRAIQPNMSGIKDVSTTVDKHKLHWQQLISPEMMKLEQQFVGTTSNFITGGHQLAFKVIQDKLEKETKLNEINFYSHFEDPDSEYFQEHEKMKKWIPKIFSINKKSKTVLLSNLCYELDNCSIIDIKMGFKTYSPFGLAIKREKELQKAIDCEQNKLGFRVAGVKVRDATGNLIVNKNGSIAYSTIKNGELVKEAIIQVLKSNGQQEINKEALNKMIEVVSEIRDFIKTSKRFYRSTSILLIVDNIAKKFNVGWIDFNYVYELNQDPESPNSPFDENLYGGLDNLHKLLQTI